MVGAVATTAFGLAVDVDEEDDGFVSSGVDDGVGKVGSVVSGVAGMEDLGVRAGFDANLAFLDGEEFAGAFEMGGAAQGAAGLELDFVKLDVFFEVERGEGADAAMFVGAVMVGVVFGANDGDRRGGVGRFEEVAEGEIKGAGNAESDGEGGVGLIAFDLAEHGAADAAGVGESFKGPAAIGAEAFDAVAEVAVDGFGLVGCFGRAFHGREEAADCRK